MALFKEYKKQSKDKSDKRQEEKDILENGEK